MGTEINESLMNQFMAAMCTLGQSIDNCTDSEWNKVHIDGPFSQVVFHALIFTDIYLGRNEEGIKEQPFHKKNKNLFKDYEELEDKIPRNVYERDGIKKYFEFCLEKGKSEISKETTEMLFGESGFSYRKFSRLELYIYMIRHIQHHAAQLGLRNQIAGGSELKWIGSGWKDL
jgi:hypothetical protein